MQAGGTICEQDEASRRDQPMSVKANIPEACDDADDGNAGYEALGSDHGLGPLTVAQPDGTEKIRVGPSVGF